MNSSAPCIVCQSETQYLLTKDTYRHVRCATCGHIFLDPKPTEQELIDLYSPKTGYQRSKSRTVSKKQPVHAMYKSVVSLAKQNDVKTILDIGCSTGDFLDFARQAGFDVTGVEPNSATAMAARDRGLSVHTGYVHDIQFADQTFDLIFLGDVIEHVLDPYDLITQVQSLLSPNGYIAICTPNADCFWSKATLALYQLTGVPWSVATPPYHISIFTPASLDQVMSSHDCSLNRRWFNHLPNLRYEIGSTRVWPSFKIQRSWRTAVRLVVVAIMYPVLFVCNLLVRLVGGNNMGMVSVYKSKHA